MSLSGQIMGAVALGTLLGSWFDSDDDHVGAGIGALAGVLVSLALVVRTALNASKK